MRKFIVLLRAVNVSGKNTIKMAALKEKLIEYGFASVQTYIQSGNVVLQSTKNATIVERQIQLLIKEEFDLEIVVFVRTIENLHQALDQSPFEQNLPGNNVFVTFLSAVPELALVNKLATIDHGQEEYLIDGTMLYFYLPEGMAKSKMNNNYFENKLKVAATGRNINTIRKLLAMANEQ